MRCQKMKVLALFTAVLVFGACSPSNKIKSPKSISSVDSLAARVTSLADEYVRDYIAAFREQVASLGLPNAANDKLSDNSLSVLKAWQAKEDGWAGELGKIDGNLLWRRPEWLTYGFLREALDGSILSLGGSSEIAEIAELAELAGTEDDPAVTSA